MFLLTVLLVIGCRGVVDEDGDGWARNEDCDESDPDRNPGADEQCNGIDDDCDGDIDEDSAIDATWWYLDADRDGYGLSWTSLKRCNKPAGYVDVGGDCNDSNDAQNPDIEELCNGIDDDCDDETDEDDAADALIWYLDQDQDGYGDPDGAAPACAQPDGFVANDRDCDDNDADVHPDQVDDVGDGRDDDCDGGVDEATLWLDAFDSVVLREHGGAYGAAMTVGDLDGDGDPDLLVGAPWTEVDEDGTAAGAVLVHTTPGDLSFTGQSAGDRAGNAVGLGDLDGDGYDDLIVGAPEALTVGTDAGAAYLLAGPVTAGGKLNSLRTAKLKGEDPHDRLGEVLAIAPGLLVVGAARFDFDGKGARAGAVYLLDAMPTDAVSVEDVAVAVRTGETAGDQVGAAVALGDLDGDGLLDLVTGAPGMSDDAGAVWRETGPFADLTTVKHGQSVSGDSEADALGSAVAVVHDVDGDGLRDVLVGAPGDDAAGDDAGAALLLSGADLGLLATLVGEVAGAAAGSAVAGGADFDGDGLGDLLVGAPAEPAAHLVLAQPEGTVLLGGAAATLHGAEGDEVGAAVLLHDELGLLLGDPALGRVWQMSTADLDL